MEVCNAERARVIKKIEEIESKTEQGDFNPETCKAVVDRHTQVSTDSIKELRYRKKLTDHIRTIKDRRKRTAMLHWERKAQPIRFGSDEDLKKLVKSDEILAPVLKELSTLGDPEVARDLLIRTSTLTRKIKLVLDLTDQDDLSALIDDIIDASEETSCKTSTEMNNSHDLNAIDSSEKALVCVAGESDWDFYVTSGDELALFHLMRKKEFIPNSLQLTHACKTFGRRSRIMKIICNLICKFIKASMKNIISVWPAYREQNTQDITFLIVLPSKNSEVKFSDIDVMYRYPENKGFEHRDVIRSAVDSNITLDDDDMNFMKLTINSHSDLLRNKHSNITAITGSPLRSQGYQKGTHTTKKENCIVLLVPIKGLIPLQEDPFPKQIGSFKIDVREGNFKWYVGGEPSDMHTDLKMGCAIGPAGRHVTGTLGGFVSHPEHGLCALTCAHVLMGEAEILSSKNIAGRRCVQPPSNTYCEFGHVVKTIFKSDGPDKPGLDIALIKIDKRAPINGYFPDMDLDTLQKAGFSEINEIKYTSGKIL